MASPIVAHLGVVSHEQWDGVWRRNQYLATNLVRGGHVGRVSFLGPPSPGFATRGTRTRPAAGIEAIVPPLVLPRSWPGGYPLLNGWRRRTLAGIDALWINDAAAGRPHARAGLPLVYDVTDDWGCLAQPARDRARTIAAENHLAHVAHIVVCSDVLAQRWQDRYNVSATLIPNGVDTAAIRTAVPRRLHGAAPHAVYVGTLHNSRIDLPLLQNLTESWPGTVHLVGPNELPEGAAAVLRAAGAELVGPVAGPQVAEWLVAADVLVCPHVIDAFTLSLDAIKAHEYLATRRPVVATASSGFQALDAPGLSVTTRSEFVPAVLAAADHPPAVRALAVDWAVRAEAFAQVLDRARHRSAQR